MLGRYSLVVTLVWMICSVVVNASCDSYSPAFALPSLSADDEEIKAAYRAIKESVEDALKGLDGNTTSYSLVVTTASETLFELHHTATDRDADRPGTQQVDGSSVYRIASNTKAFTVLALLQLQKSGHLSLDDPINKYLPELEEGQTGSLPWKDISLRTLATQLSGIPRNLGTTDLKDGNLWPALGLPLLPDEDQAVCDSIYNFTRSCTSDDLYKFLRVAEPLFAPKQESTYSNINFVLLGQVIEKLSGMPYEDYIHKNILQELKMSSTTFKAPPDLHAVLPKGRAAYYDMYMEVQNPTGGLYSTTDDMAKWARYILTNYNGLSITANWLFPHSYSTGLYSFYGMPWEIHRTDQVLSHSKRPITFVTKSGGWPGYTSLTVVVPEYGIGYVVLVGSEDLFSDFSNTAAEIVGQKIVEAADAVAHQQLRHQHTGTFSTQAHTNVNTSITFSHSEEQGLYISSWISNSVNVLEGYRLVFMGGDMSTPMRPQVVPTLLFKDEKNKRGEIWRIIIVKGENSANTGKPEKLMESFCITDVDTMAFGGRPLGEIVFWSQGADGVYAEVELTGWRVRLQRTTAPTDKLISTTDPGTTNVAAGGLASQKIFGRVGMS